MRSWEVVVILSNQLSILRLRVDCCPSLGIIHISLESMRTGREARIHSVRQGQSLQPWLREQPPPDHDKHAPRLVGQRSQWDTSLTNWNFDDCLLNNAY